MKKIGKLAVAGLLATLGVTAMASCGGNSVAKAAVGKVIINQDGEHVTEDFELPKIVKNGEETFNVTWTSSDTSVLNIVDGNTADVKRPFDKNTDVKLTATVEADGSKASTSFKTTVDAIPYEEAVKASLGISNGYNTKKVDVDLPTSSKEFKDEIQFTYTLVGTPTTVKLEGTKLTIDPTSETKEIAKLKVNAVSSVTKEIEVDVKVNSYTTIEAYDAAEAGALVTVKGIIAARESYSAKYQNTTLYLQDVSGKGGYDAYRLKCESQDAYDKDLAIGNVILVTGKKKVYNGLREFNDGSTYEVAATGKTPKDTDITNLIKADASQVNKDYQCQLVHFNELTVVEVEEKDNKGRWNIIVGDAADKKKQFSVRIDTYLLPTSSDAYKAIDAMKIAAGDVISAKGVCGWNNNAQILATDADSITIVTKGTSAPAEKTEFTGVVTAIGFKAVKNGTMRSYVLVQNAEGAAKFVFIEAPIDDTNTEAVAKEKINAKFVVGKSVTVKGLSKTPNGLNQHVVAWESLDADVTLGAEGTVPDYADVNAKVGNETELKALQGVLVTVTGTYDGKGNLVVSEGKSIAVYYENGFLAENPLTRLKENGKYTVTGFVNWYNKPQISPIAANAVVVVDESNVQTLPAITVDKTITFDDKAKRTEQDKTHQIWAENGITVTNEKAASQSDVPDYANPARFYAKSDLTVSAEQNIKALVFTYTSNKMPTTLTIDGCQIEIDTQAKTCKIVLDTPAKSFKITLPQQWQVVSIGVDFAE